MTQDAPEAIAQAYGRMAWNAIRDGQLRKAVELINRGRDAAPTMKQILTARVCYVRYQALDDYLITDTALDVRKVRSEISALSTEDPNVGQAVVPILARDLASRIHATSDPELASRLSRAGREIFGRGPPFDKD